MPRQNRTIEGLIQGACKVRKRGCSSSSSSSSILHNYRLKRALLVGKRGGSNTPVPTWKLSTRSPSTIAGADSLRYQPSQNATKAKQGPVSARKLAATLWEMNEIPPMQQKEDLQEKRIKKEIRGKERNVRSVQSGSLLPHLSDPSHSPGSENADRSGTGSIRRRMAAMSQRYRLNERNGGGLDSLSNASLMEIETRSRGLTPTGSMVGIKSRFKELGHGLTTSKELLKILNRIWGLEEQHSSSMSLVSALRVELERARVQVDQLIQEQKSDRNEINYLMKRFTEEKACWKSKELEKIRSAVQSVAGDLDVERKLRKRMESLNKRLTSELSKTKTSLSQAVKELESERKARELMEQVCDELARGIGKDKAEVEELKRESAKVWEEVEKEREMLQLAEVWREERVQMKLSEAKFQLEEKNAALDKLRTELEAFLRAKKTKDAHGGVWGRTAGVKEEHRRTHPSKTNETHEQGTRGDGNEEDDDDDDDDGNDDGGDSAESDLHSIELNRDDNCKGYMWSYKSGALVEDPKRPSMEEETKGRRSGDRRGNGSLDRGVSGEIEWDSSFYSSKNCTTEVGQGRSSMCNGSLKKQVSGQDLEEEAQRYKSLKGARDHTLAGSRGPPKGFASPTRQWSPRWPSQDSGDGAGFDRLKVAEMVRGMRESGLKGKEGQQHSRQK